jgi:hypothetical protein
MLFSHFSVHSKGQVSFPASTMGSCLWAVKFMVDQVAPYPNISCLLDAGIRGLPRVPLDAIPKTQKSVTIHGNGTFKYEVALNIPVSYNTCNSCTSTWIILYHQIKYLQSSFNTLHMTLFHFCLLREEANSQR